MLKLIHSSTKSLRHHSPADHSLFGELTTGFKTYEICCMWLVYTECSWFKSTNQIIFLWCARYTYSFGYLLANLFYLLRTLDTLHLIFMSHAVYTILITDLLNPEAAALQPWSLAVCTLHFQMIRLLLTLPWKGANIISVSILELRISVLNLWSSGIDHLHGATVSLYSPSLNVQVLIFIA